MAWRFFQSWSWIFLGGWGRMDAIVRDRGLWWVTISMNLFARVQSIPAWMWIWPQIGRMKISENQTPKMVQWLHVGRYTCVSSTVRPACKRETVYGHWKTLRWPSSSLLYLYDAVSWGGQCHTFIYLLISLSFFIVTLFINMFIYWTSLMCFYVPGHLVSP